MYFFACATVSHKRSGYAEKISPLRSTDRLEGRTHPPALDASDIMSMPLWIFDVPCVYVEASITQPLLAFLHPCPAHDVILDLMKEM
mmetsp:Transcript_117296/g.215882  ORF Transcript_117296/g.215882 Transcript_117296/m.215882 type:complete len:87 (+) Transcript_117296:24-284(+)